ncbi:hypothetical protein LCGC14_2597220 [marine sediment metagenome]|uniref:Uncharacterized protein n=1 Tax=marine sediment metagenome TaxID=412755 RepID=A0A0F9D2K1_9ZZZZ
MTKKKSKNPQPKKPEEKASYFDDVLQAILGIINEKVRILKTRRGGASKYGADAMFICGTESLAAGQENRNVDSYIQAAAYAVAASMQLIGQWEIEFAPPPEEKAPEPPAPEKEEEKK